MLRSSGARGAMLCSLLMLGGLSQAHAENDGFGPDVDFDDATGPTVEVGWRWIALSYTNLDYKDGFGGEWDASNFGLKLTSKF